MKNFLFFIFLLNFILSSNNSCARNKRFQDPLEYLDKYPWPEDIKIVNMPPFNAVRKSIIKDHLKELMEFPGEWEKISVGSQVWNAVFKKNKNNLVKYKDHYQLSIIIAPLYDVTTINEGYRYKGRYNIIDLKHDKSVGIVDVNTIVPIESQDKYIKKFG
jgi:hypothetical protein